MKIFLPSFFKDIVVKWCIPLGFISPNIVNLYLWFHDPTRYKTFLFIFAVVNCVFLFLYCIAIVFSMRVSPHVIINNGTVIFCHRSTSKKFQLKDIDRFEIRKLHYLGAGGEMVERRLFVLLCNGEKYQVHESLYGPMKKAYQTFCSSFEEFTCKKVVTITEIEKP